MKKTGTGAAVKRERVPQAERRRITRGKLLDATIDSLIDRGYARTTTVEVGERTGLSRGTQLHHFPSKADLLVAAIEHLAEQGIEADYMRIRSFPFHASVEAFLREHDRVFVVEQNRDAQMKSLLMLEANDIADRLVSILHYNGMPIPSECVVTGIMEHQGTEAAA